VVSGLGGMGVLFGKVVPWESEEERVKPRGAACNSGREKPGGMGEEKEVQTSAPLCLGVLDLLDSGGEGALGIRVSRLVGRGLLLY